MPASLSDSFPGNLYAAVETRFPADRSRSFLILEDGRQYSYDDLDRITARYANLLVELGVRIGDRVTVQVEKSPEALFLYLACMRAGAVYQPLNTAYTQSEIAYFLGDAEPSLLVCRPETEAALRPVAEAAGVKTVLTLDTAGTGGSLNARAAGQSETFATVTTGADDLAAILYTSGTTGRSKGAMLSHGNLISNAAVLHRYWGFVPGDVLLHALPIFHTHGLFVATNCILMNGSSMLFLPKFDADTVIRLLPSATVMMGVPTFYVRLLAHGGFTREVAAHMRLFVSGSAPLLEETFRAFEERTGMRILERYGMTETNMNTSNPYDGDRRPGTVGFPLPGVSVRIAGEDGTVLPTGEIGVLEVKGPNVFSGYWRMPEKTAEEFRDDGYFITGDVARIDADGYVSIVGRAKDLVITGGFNVYPKEIELIVDEIDGVDESAVIGVPHPDFGEAVAAVVRRKPGAAGPSAEDVIAVAKARLANFKVPKAVFFVDELPRNAMGKVQKNALRDAYKSTFK